MSSEFTVSETTPLRASADKNIISIRSSRDNLIIKDTTVISTNHIYQHHQDHQQPHNNNNNTTSTYNNRFNPEDQLPPAVEHLLESTNSNTAITMDTNRQIFRKVIIDFTILLCVGFPILFFFLFGEPYERGFFCGDESIMYPFRDSTVKNWMLYIIGLVLPIAIIAGTEYIKENIHPKPPNYSYKFLEWNIPPLIVQLYKQIGIFGFGVAISQLTTDIAKYSIGRLRPHFIDVCQPIFNGNTNCSHPSNLGKYHIYDYKCSNPLSTKRMIKEMRLSFPSGHSSFSFYTMVYCAIYLHSRMTWRGSKLLKHFLQFILVMLAWATALSRVSNYKHHWSDALAGSLIGTVCALVVANYVSDLCDNRTNKYILPTATTIPQSSSAASNATRHEMMITSNQQSTNGRV